MLRHMAWQATDDLTRAQLTMFHRLGEAVGLTGDDLRRALALDERTWIAWGEFRAEGPLPAEPPVPDMLRRLGETSFELAAMFER